MTRAPGTDRIGDALALWVGWVLRYRRLTIALGLAAAGLSLYYAVGHLGVNTDTADMISPELEWRRHYIDYREIFPTRDRNIVAVVEAGSPEQADALAASLAEALSARPDLYRSVFLAGAGAFFERHALMYLSVSELEALADRLAMAQPLLGRLGERFDGSTLLEVLGEARANAGAASTSAGALEVLSEEMAEAIAAAAAGRREELSWQRVMGGGGDDAGTRRLLLLGPVLDFTRARPAAEPIEHFRALASKLSSGAGPAARVRLTGTVAMEHEELTSVSRGAGLAGLASLVMVAVVLYAALGSLTVLAIAVTVLVAGLAMTAAFAAVAVGHLNLLSVAFAVLYIGLGVDFILHLCLRLKELVAAGRALEPAVVAAVRGVGASLLVCAVTTAAGFYSFIPTPFVGVSELGLISGTGMFISLIISTSLLPALIVELEPALASHRPAAAGRGSRLAGSLLARPGRVVAAAAFLTVAALATLPRLEFDNNPVRLRDPASESVATLADLTAEGAAGPMQLVAIAEDRETAQRWAATLERLTTVRDVRTLDEFVPGSQTEKRRILEDIELMMGPDFASLSRSAPEPEAFRRSLEALRASLTQDTAASDAEAALLGAVTDFLAALQTLTPPARREALIRLEAALVDGLPAQLARLAGGLEAEPFGRGALPGALTERWLAPGRGELIEIAPAENINEDAEAARRFVESVRGVVGHATGLPVVHQEASSTVIRAFRLALTYALLIVALLLWVFLRRVTECVMVIIPVLVAAVLTAGASVWLGIPFNFANIIALPLLLGVGVDNGIHILMRLRTEPPSGGNLFVTSTSRAVLASGVTTIASFGNLAFAAHVGMASMGQLLTLGMAVTMAATLLLLPTMLKLAGRQ